MKTKGVKKNNKKNLSHKKNMNKDLYGFIIISIGILFLLSLFSSKMGIIGAIIQGSTFSFMGFGAYFFPMFLIFTGIVFIIEKFDKKEKLSIISTILLFLTVLIILDGRNPLNLTFVERVENSISLSKLGRGGGIIGSLFGFFFYKLFGSVGTYFVLSLIIIVNLLLITGIRVRDFVSNIVNYFRDSKLNDSKPYISNSMNDVPSSKDEIRVIDYGTQSRELSNKKTESKDAKNDIEKEINIGTNKNLASSYYTPSINLLTTPANQQNLSDEKEILNNARKIEETMKNFGIDAKILEINVGPTITCYELQPSPGIKLNRIVSLSDNIALSLASSDIRIEAPIPGKSAVGIEVPNRTKSNVSLKEILNSKEYIDIDSNLPLALGKDVSGKVIVSTIDKMPHLLIAGATGSGKSVCINTIIMSIIFKSSPEDVKLLLIDPKVVELSVYNGIPHLLIPVVTDAKKATFALNWAVEEMEKRYKLFAENSVRDMASYNSKMKVKEDKLPNIVIIIDELADLMMVAAQEIEDYICRLAQMARASGIYLIVATQRPSVDVITGTIKANIPSRISFAVSSQVDSRTILDISGAEKLLGKGDMLFYPSFYSKPARIQGAFISSEEVEAVVDSLKSQEISNYDPDIIEIVDNPKELTTENSDELLPEAISLVVDEGQASVSYLQRKLKIGYARAARIIDEMEDRGIIGGYEGSRPRKVLISKEDLESMRRGE